ncbi:MAG: hypothetical protein LBL28_00675 [Treponema sp.]|jgi:hypothetical protein|nr:hypothetical protein [Treponema sp.]
MNNDMKNIIEDAIADYVIELDDDAVGLWQIIRRQNRFGLSEDDSKKFMREAIISLMQNGAVPVVSGEQGYDWKETGVFGESAENIADNISAKWSKNIKTKGTIFNLDGVWFARPAPGKKYVKLLKPPQEAPNSSAD